MNNLAHYDSIDENHELEAVFDFALRPFTTFYKSHLQPTEFTVAELRKQSLYEHLKDVNLGSALIRAIHALSVFPILSDIYVLSGLRTDRDSSEGKTLLEETPLEVWDKYYKDYSELLAPPWLKTLFDYCCEFFKQYCYVKESIVETAAYSMFYTLLGIAFIIPLLLCVVAAYSPILIPIFLYPLIPLGQALPDLIVGTIKAIPSIVQLLAYTAVVSVVAVLIALPALVVYAAYKSAPHWFKNSLLTPIIKSVTDLLSGLTRAIKDFTKQAAPFPQQMGNSPTKYTLAAPTAPLPSMSKGARLN